MIATDKKLLDGDGAVESPTLVSALSTRLLSSPPDYLS